MNRGMLTAQAGVFGFSDAAQRCSDQVRLHILGDSGGRWAAIRLSDGGSDGIAYGTRREAILGQLHETQCAYLQIPRDDMSVAAAETYLAVNRHLYDQGYRLVDPDNDRQIIMPMRSERLPR